MNVKKKIASGAKRVVKAMEKQKSWIVWSGITGPAREYVRGTAEEAVKQYVEDHDGMLHEGDFIRVMEKERTELYKVVVELSAAKV